MAGDSILCFLHRQSAHAYLARQRQGDVSGGIHDDALGDWLRQRFAVKGDE